jgi:inhibitor of cysteine peptidase
LALCLTGCDPKTVYVTEAESGRTIVLSVGQELVITLASNPTTGYNWSHQSSSPNVLRVAEEKYVATEPVLIGSGGEHRVVFSAAATGQTTLRFEYRRPWETAAPAEQVVEYDVQVE